MKLHQGLMIFALTLTVMTGDLSAQDSKDRMFGNGKFLRRMKNEIMGDSSKAEPKKKSPKKAKSKDKSPTSAMGRSKSLTPAIKASSPWSAKRPTLAKRPSGSDPQLNSSKVGSLLDVTKRGKAPVTVTRSSRKPTLGFGMLLEIRQDMLVVTQLDPKGNAAKSGVKRSDVVVEAGGIEMKTMQEFNDVTDVLQDGDQIEFVLLRRGKKEKMLIMHGKGPEQEVADEQAIEPALAAYPKSIQATRKYEFVPLASDKNSIHVNDMPSVIATKGQASRSNQPFVQAKHQLPNPQGVIDQQRLQIQKMQLEIERLRSAKANSPNDPSPIQMGTNLGGLDLSGPGQ